ncbi:MAG: hypothetical protein LBS99_01815, partial [Clostridiales bacterium]|nr:hypothetical protein [Clostridiales bacterium]
MVHYEIFGVKKSRLPKNSAFSFAASLLIYKEFFSVLKLFKKLKPYALWVTLAIAFILGQSLLELWLPDIMSKVIGLIGVSDAQSRMLTYGLQAGGVALGAFACAVGVAFLSARIAAAFGRDLRRDVFNKIESF